MSELSLLLVFRLPIPAAARLHPPNLLLDLFVLEVYESMLLTLEGVFVPELPLKLVVAGIVAIIGDDLLPCMVDAAESVGHPSILCIDRVPFFYREVPIVFLPANGIDGVIDTVREVVFDFRLHRLQVLVVVSLVLKDKI